MSHLAYFDTTLAESIVQVGLPGNFGDLSMVVLTARNSIGEVAQVSIVLPTNLHVAQLQQTWLKLQDEMAVISSNSTHIFVKVNSHSIHLYHPDLLLDAIRQVVEKTC
jgi:hypothetical protein